MSVQNTAINRAIALLNAAGAKYKVIAPDGTEHGELVIATEPPKKPRKMNREFAWGERTAYVRAHIETMKPGDVKVIPYGPYGKTVMQITSSTAHDMWGVGAHIVSSAKDGVELLRVQ